MKIQELIDQLTKLVGEDDYRKDMEVTFGPEREPIEGGIIGVNTETKLAELNLAPIKLDQVGGF
jgi:hypothetical protein